MTLQAYAIKYGRVQVLALALLCGREPSYFSHLINAGNSKKRPFRCPSMKTAQEMVRITNGELTLDGLFNPEPIDTKSLDRWEHRKRSGHKGLIKAMETRG